MALTPSYIHIDYSGELTFTFYDADGAVADLSATGLNVTKMTLEFFTRAGTVVLSKNSTTHSSMFVTTDYATGVLVFRWVPSAAADNTDKFITTEKTTLMGTNETAQYKMRFAMTTATWTTPGRVVEPRYPEVIFTL